MQTDDEMKDQLLQKGLGDSVFDAGDGRQMSGDEMVRLVRVLAAMEESLTVLERRGIALRTHAERLDPENEQTARLSRLSQDSGTIGCKVESN